MLLGTYTSYANIQTSHKRTAYGSELLIKTCFFTLNKVAWNCVAVVAYFDGVMQDPKRSHHQPP